MPNGNPNVIAFMLSQRLRRIERVPCINHAQGVFAATGSWIIWLDTADYQYGTYMQLMDDGRMFRCTVREDGNDECIDVRPSDEEIANDA